MSRLMPRRTLLASGAGAAATAALAACGDSTVRRRQSSSIDLANVWPWGANTFLNLEVETWKRRQTLQMVNEAGIRWIKQHAPWADIETPARGQYFDSAARRSTWDKYDEIVDLAEEAGVDIIARIDRAPAWARVNKAHPTTPPTNYVDYGRFLSVFADRYRGRVRHYQIWNEPNLAHEWGGAPPQPEAYARLLRAANLAIKSVDEDNVVIAAPMAATLEN
ncbi:MAG: cellulase family glycosylhydrolase, partial [Chloroflexota bacterium]|nr:cellulase family glycosylhydrolase [Chloroflexota bacterium]